MNSEDFTLLFGVLQRSAETARSAFYAFVIVYAAMLFYAMNTYVYPISQHLLTSVRDQINSGRDCEPGHIGPFCLRASPPFDKLNADYAAHVLEYFQDRSTDDRVFHVPLVGLSSDRNWFWLINVAGSFLLYTLVRGALQKYHSLMAYLFNENRQQASRVVLLSTTQIITAGEPPAGRGATGQGSSIWSESFAIRCLLLMPIMVSGTIIFDWLYLLYTADDKRAFVQQYAALIGFIATLAALWWQVRMFQQILATIYRLFAIDRLKQLVVQDATAGDASVT
jgi:hypothetical protein